MATNTRTPHRRTVRLPLGYKATFSFSPETGFACQWHPGLPRIESNRAWRKFHDTYVGERNAFLSEAAALMGVAVVVAGDGGAVLGLPEERR